MEVKKIFTPRMRAEGQIPPPFPYIRTYDRWECDYTVYYIFPLNYIVQLGLIIHHTWKYYQNKPSIIDKLVERKAERIVKESRERKVEYAKLNYNYRSNP